MARSQALNMVTTILARFAGKSVNLVVFSIVARSLSVSDLAVYGFVFATSLLIATVFDFGVRNSLAYYIGKKDDLKRAYLTQSIIIAVPLALLAGGSIATTIYFQRLDSTFLTVIIPAIINTVSLLFIRMQQGVLIGAGLLFDFNRSEMAPRLVLLAITVPVFFLGDLDLVAALYILAASNVFGAIALAGILAIRIGFEKPTELGLSKHLLRRGFLFMLGVVAMLLAKQIPFFVISQTGTTIEAGHFFGTRRLTEIITEIALAISVVMFSNNVRAHSREDALLDAASSTRIAFTIFSIVALVSYFAAPILIRIFLGEDFVGQVHIFRILLLGTLFGTIWTMIFPSLTAIESPLVAFFVFVPNLLLAGILSFLFYKLGGAEGVAWGTVLVQGLISLSFLAVFKFRHHIRMRDFIIVKKNDIKGIAHIVRRRKGRQT